MIAAMRRPDSKYGLSALEASARCAGHTLACSYSSAEEFEAAMIAARRKSAAYHAMSRQRALYGTGVLLGLLVVIGALII
jgi:hypothetical protein